ncbi:hypothetical protein L486_05587 [Kwoniella mangroviensis CBS 10435]|uniref:Uncharacterized protein n=1 Tax=Kwoniella mangroviensis CBS 10435 TaxID=1331196 RepID=A0A1B9IME8_9TREE|nr:hypothetical protein L486_05587 [Kwoniella mangroviensis CBS 10435]
MPHQTEITTPEQSDPDVTYLPGVTIHHGPSDYAAIRDGKMYGVQRGSENWKIVHAMVEKDSKDPRIMDTIIRLADDVTERY